MADLAILSVVLATVSLLKVRIRDLPLTEPMVFVAIGVILSPDLGGVLRLEVGEEAVALAAEFTLALLLFSDAARINVPTLRRSVALPARLLGIGLPLTITLGTVVTALLLTDLSWIEAALVAAILAPTDAALGEAVVTNPAVPVRIRQALNVESGLNDGLVVPVIALFLALASGSELDGPGSLAGEALIEIALGLLIGVGVAVAMSWAIPRVTAKGWTNAEGQRLVALGCALTSFAGATALGGNGFLAAFACGLVASRLLGMEAPMYTELAEGAGQVGASATFVMFGALLVIPALEILSIPVVVCAAATLTVVRMLPVWVSMWGTGLKVPTVVFMGWFGPRGLASVVFGFLVVGSDGIARSGELFSVIVLVILSSVVLHGMTAAHGATAYSRWFAGHGRQELAAEAETVPEIPVASRCATESTAQSNQDRSRALDAD